ncbi:hypothetical protein ACQ4PT_025603 [Festuca glaucescens]
MAVPSPFLAPHPLRPDPAVPPDASADCPPSLDFGDPASLATLRGLTDAGAATRLLHECVAYQRALDARLDALLARRPDLDRAAASLLRSAPPLLSLAASDASALRDSSSSTAALADALSSRVRHLDAAHSRAESALARAEAALDRSRALDAARRALAADDLTAAASAAHEFLAIDSRFPTDDDLRRDLLDIKRRLEGLARRRLSAAVDAQDHPVVLRLVRLFPLLALADEGLQVYVAYLKNVVALRARADFEHLTELISATTQPTPERPDFVGCLTRLFKDIVLAVEENDAVLRELRGEDAVAYAIIELQEECDTRGTQILRRYADYRKLARLSSDINSYTKNLLSVVGSVANAAGGNEGPDPREVEHYLEEILALTQLGEDYTEFMVNKIRGLRDVKPELGPQAMKAFRNGSFSKMEKDLTGFYVILEEFFMVENIRKAIRIDEPVPDGLTTSMVDDVFFLLQSCCRRAASTASINSLLAVLGGATSLLSNEYQEALQWRMREPNLGAKLFLGGVGVHKTGEEIATALNNMDVSSEYVLKLRHEIEELCPEIFHAPADREKIKSCLSELGEINASFKKILHSGLEHLVASVAPRIRHVLDIVTTVSYELDDAEYGENEVNDPWVQKLLLAVDTNVAWLQPMMTSNNYDSFVHLIIDFIVKRLEVIMMQKRFSQLGGLQLDKDVRSLINHFSEMSQRPVRDKFSRLSQMSTILNFERVSEILDFWGDNAGHLTWLLTPAEVRRVLGLRIDFRPEAISALRL